MPTAICRIDSIDQTNARRPKNDSHYQRLWGFTSEHCAGKMGNGRENGTPSPAPK